MKGRANSSEKRLARILLLLANFGKESRPEPIIAKIGQETLAEMIGTTRSRVSCLRISHLKTQAILQHRFKKGQSACRSAPNAKWDGQLRP
jgi:hypothetical protein